MGVSFPLLSTRSGENHNREGKKNKPTTKPKYNTTTPANKLFITFMSGEKKSNFSKLNDLTEDVRIRWGEKKKKLTL